MSKPTAIRPVLHHCARLTGSAAFYADLTEACQPLSNADWASLIQQAEYHGLGPLLYQHLKHTQVEPPPAVWATLKGLYLRHKRGNQVRLRELTEIARHYQQAGIEMMVLKGAVLSQILYPSAALRPMSDLDILVPDNQAARAQTCLQSLGFTLVSPQAEGQRPEKHLVAYKNSPEGVPVQVEIHRTLFHHQHPESTTWAALSNRQQRVTLMNGFEVNTLQYELMLWHLCQHIAFHTHVWRPTRLIWVTDIVSLAEKVAPQMDWAAIRRDYPLVLTMLALFHHLIPLSPDLQKTAGIVPGPCPQCLGRNFDGWPAQSIQAQRDKGWPQILRDSFFPSDWWLRLRYKRGPQQSIFWQRWLYHPWHILRWVGDWILSRW